MRVPKWARESKDMIVQYLVANGIPVTRRNYVMLDWMGDKDPRKELGAECEADLPKQLQRKRR